MSLSKLPEMIKQISGVKVKRKYYTHHTCSSRERCDYGCALPSALTPTDKRRTSMLRFSVMPGRPKWQQYQPLINALSSNEKERKEEERTHAHTFLACTIFFFFFGKSNPRPLSLRERNPSLIRKNGYKKVENLEWHFRFWYRKNNMKLRRETCACLPLSRK